MLRRCCRTIGTPRGFDAIWGEELRRTNPAFRLRQLFIGNDTVVVFNDRWRGWLMLSLVSYLLLQVGFACYFLFFIAVLRGHGAICPPLPRLPESLRPSGSFSAKWILTSMLISSTWTAVIFAMDARLDRQCASASFAFQSKMRDLETQADILQVEAAKLDARYKSSHAPPAILSSDLRSFADVLSLGLTSAKKVRVQAGGFGLQYSGDGLWSETNQLERNLDELHVLSAELEARCRIILRRWREATNEYESQIARLQKIHRSYWNFDNGYPWQVVILSFLLGPLLLSAPKLIADIVKGRESKKATSIVAGTANA